ncbi:MAG: ribosome small subunit-dependent GTPase A [Acholeplasmatales bacterium]|nr:ribosome small subunit-dependent GTPase A [Acholeplasmatales bacterium]
MEQGRVINLCGGVYKVLMENGEIKSLKARGKLRSEKTYQVNNKSLSKKKDVQYIKNSPKVGDVVLIDNDMIDSYMPRKNEMIRPDIANVDQILLVFAAKEPDFSFYLLDLFIVNIIREKIKPLIVISKIDKLSEEELLDLKSKMKYYIELGYDVLFVNSLTKEGIEDLKEHLKNKITVLSGQTGAGKSTLINAIIPDFSLQTQEISKSLGRGKHTTRETNLYVYENGFIGDTPGFSKLDLSMIDKDEIKYLFEEFKNYGCFFKDCNHKENIKGCGIHEAVNNGLILKSRYESYLKMYQLKENK